MEKEETIKTSVMLNRPRYDKLKIKILIPRRISLMTWMDKHMRKDLGESPAFSYPEEKDEE